MGRELLARKKREASPVLRDIACRDDGSKRRILYAEDQSSTRIVTTALLIRMGFEVEAVEDGELALEKARTSAFDIILLDIEMPNMDGVTAARHIKADKGPCQHTPIMAMSAFLADSTEHSVWRDAFDSALPKPANSNELLHALSKVIDGKRDFAPSDPTRVLPSLWHDLTEGLPRGTRTLMVKTATQELHHLILALSSCIEAGDQADVDLVHGKLQSLAGNFEVTGLVDILSTRQNLRDDIVPMLMTVAKWQAAYVN